jgi:hypothetical protein
MRRRRPKREVLRAAWLGGFAVVAIAWVAARIVSDHFAWSQWCLWIPTPLALLAAFLTLPVAARRRDRRRPWRVAGVLAMVAAMSVSLLTIEHRFVAPRPTRPDGVRLVHWNMSWPAQSQAERFGRRVPDFESDIVLISSPGHLVRSPSVQQWLGDEGVYRRLGVFAALVRVPIIECRELRASDRTYVALLRLDTTEQIGRDLTILLVDLPSMPLIGRMALARDLRRDLGADDVPVPDIVVGDLNITRGSAALATLFPALHHAWDDAGSGYGATFPRLVPLYHIDHVLLADDLVATEYEIIDPGIGLHLPQRARIAPR